MKISIQSFKGVAPRINPRYLPDGGAQVALNVEAFGQSLKPLKGLGSVVTTLTKSGTLTSLYRFGQDETNAANYWCHWPYPVDVCRGQIAGDTSEWTFYTDYSAANTGGFPKATYNTLVLAGGGTDYPVQWRRLGLPAPTANLTGVVTQPTAETVAAAVTLTSANLGAMTATYGLKVSVDNGETYTACSLSADAPTAAQAKTAIDASASSLVETLVDGTSLKVTSKTKGSTVKLVVRWSDATTGAVSGAGTTKDLGTLETRTYTYTWIANESGLVVESAPQSSVSMNTFDVYPGGSVLLGGFSTPPTTGGYLATGVRVYRSTSGTFLFVGEKTLAQLAAAGNSFDDTLDADELGEALTSTGWSMPPAELQGLINLPNGAMAGFVGREVYFSAPYRPYAWPDEYRQTVDFPVVGLGRTDTTLVVLTTGTPYLMQGASPEYVTVVKSDLEQACVSKRSIVSMGGAVVYASPDGLMLLAPGKSQNLTEALFDRDDWQALGPATIHAYGHDNKYVAFHAAVTLEGVSYTGFVFDFSSGQFIRHNVSGITAGYADLRNDALYLVNASKQVVAWGAGATNLTGKWRSKIYGLPQVTGFSCAQVEAEAYDAGLKCRLYRTDPGTRTPHATSLSNEVLTSRAPFRLEAKQGRDWEVELDVTQEIFNVCIAQSMDEIATA